MIDTDKYEGHLMDKAVEDNSQVWAWHKWMLKNSKTVDVKNITATIELLNDAPLLLAEVLRLRERVKTEKNLNLWEKAEVKRLREWIEQVVDVWENCNHEDRTDWFNNFCEVMKND